jgi:putative membrane protein
MFLATMMLLADIQQLVPYLDPKNRGGSMYYFWGMHAYWWLFWVFLWMLFFSFMMPMRRTTYRQMQTPLEILQRRYAAGELTTEEYEERRTTLQRDATIK